MPPDGECWDHPERHLLTLQEGVSETQFRLIRTAGIKLVIPEGGKDKFAPNIRTELQSVESFMTELRTLPR